MSRLLIALMIVLTGCSSFQKSQHTTSERVIRERTVNVPGVQVKALRSDLLDMPSGASLRLHSSDTSKPPVYARRIDSVYIIDCPEHEEQVADTTTTVATTTTTIKEVGFFDKLGYVIIGFVLGAVVGFIGAKFR